MNKVVSGSEEAIKDVFDGAVIMMGSFGLNGLPENMIKALVKKKVKDLTTISCTANVGDYGLGQLLSNRQVKKVISTYVGENKVFEQQALDGTIEIDLVPQGTLAERIRARGVGIPAFYTPTGFGTEVAEGKEVKEFNGRKYLMEEALPADFGLVKAWKGDTAGNLIFRHTANNYNNLIAMAADITIVEVEELVPAGELDPNHIHTPGIFVQRIYQGEIYEKRIEFLTTRD